MAAWTYDESLSRLLVHEGGYTNNPSDPGGPTNFGITIYDARKYAAEFDWIKGRSPSAADVRAMPLWFAKKVYKAKYWDAQACDELPAGVDYAAFDYGVNSGIGRSKKVLQRAVGVAADGALGAATMRAVAAHDAKEIIEAICDERLRFLQALRTWPVFGRGWGRRVAEVRSVALAMAAKAPLPSVQAAAAPARGRATVAVPKAAQQGSAGAIVAAGAVAAQQAHQNGHSPKVIAAIAVLAAAGAVAAWLFWQWRQRKQQEKPA